MEFKPLCALVAFCLVVCVVESLPRHQAHVRSKRSMRLCGHMLVDALAAVCEHTYYDPNRVQVRKRNYAYSADAYPGWEDSAITEFNSFMDPQTALDFLGLQMTRSPRGVADECCLKSCTFSQLMSYCGPSTTKK